jgi:recombination protein RecA
MARKSKDEQQTEQQETRTSQVLASEALKAMSKRWGGNILVQASDESVQTVPRIPSGILKLDWALGGGWPTGRFNMVYGPKSAAKTSLMIKALAEASKVCALCCKPKEGEVHCECESYRETVSAFIDVEGTYDPVWAKRLGLDATRIIYSRPSYAEQSLDILEALIREGAVDNVVLDSIAFLSPKKEIESSVEQETVGVQARLLGKSMRKLVAALNHVKATEGRMPTIFMTNQIRMKVGVMFGNPETTSGGMAPGYATTAEVKLWPGKYQMDEESGRALSVDMNFRVDKNKSAAPKMEGEYRLILADTDTKHVGDIYEEDAMVNLGQKFGLVEGHGNSWTCLGEKFNGKSLIERKLLTDATFKGVYRSALMKILLTAT